MEQVAKMISYFPLVKPNGLNINENCAKIIDVGGQSTRPGSKTISPEVEWRRIKFVIEKFKKKIQKKPVYQLTQENLI